MEQPKRLSTAARWIGGSACVVHIGLLLLLWLAGPRTLWGDEIGYLAAARDALAGNPDWWPMPLWPPLYPWFLAGVLAVSRGALWGVIVAQTVLLFITGAVFADLTRRWTGSDLAAAFGFAWMVAFPSLAAFGSFLWPEVLHLALMMILFWILAARIDRIGWLVIAGISLGLALLTKSLLGPFAPFLLVGAFWGRWNRRTPGRLAVVLVAAALVVAPVVIRQHQRTGIPMIADSGAFNLWAGLNDQGAKSFEDDVAYRTYRDFTASGTTFADRNRAMRERCRRFIAEQGIGTILARQVRWQYHRFFDKDSYLTEQMPGGAAVRQGSGFTGASGGVARLVRGLDYGSWALLLLLAPLGYLVPKFKHRRWPRIFLGFLAYHAVLFLMLHVKSRYRVQLLPVFFLGGSTGMAYVVTGILRGGAGFREVRIRLVIAGGISLGLLWLAF